MTDRIIDISETSAFLKVENRLLVIKIKEQVTTIPLSDIAVLIISNPAITLTHSVLAQIANLGGIIVVSDNKYLPAGMLLPLQNHHIQTRRFINQAEASLPIKKKAWQEIISAKIRNQGEFLNDINGSDAGLIQMSKKVKSGDKDNLEAIAAKKYWKHFNIIEKRDRFGDDANMFLNYGYAVLHSMTARAICASGLHPALGINHHNKYNPFCLASDLMEPFRPIVDKAVYEISKLGKTEINRETKAMLIKPLLGQLALNEEAQTIFYAITRLTSSLASIYEGKRKKLILPDYLFLDD